MWTSGNYPVHLGESNAGDMIFFSHCVHRQWSNCYSPETSSGWKKWSYQKAALKLFFPRLPSEIAARRFVPLPPHQVQFVAVVDPWQGYDDTTSFHLQCEYDIRLKIVVIQGHYRHCKKIVILCTSCTSSPQFTVFVPDCLGQRHQIHITGPLLKELPREKATPRVS